MGASRPATRSCAACSSLRHQAVQPPSRAHPLPLSALPRRDGTSSTRPFERARVEPELSWCTHRPGGRRTSAEPRRRPVCRRSVPHRAAEYQLYPEVSAPRPRPHLASAPTAASESHSAPPGHLADPPRPENESCHLPKPCPYCSQMIQVGASPSPRVAICGAPAAPAAAAGVGAARAPQGASPAPMMGNAGALPSAT